MLCVFIFPIYNSKLCMTDRDQKVAAGQVKAGRLCPFDNVTWPELRIPHLACGQWPADFTHNDRTAALMFIVLCAIMNAYMLQPWSIWERQSDLSNRPLCVCVCVLSDPALVRVWVRPKHGSDRLASLSWEWPYKAVHQTALKLQ